MSAAVAAPPAKRLLSLDALRGFDMFWIIGGDAVAGALAALTKNETAKSALAQVSEHIDWVGLRYYDMIFPLFLFIIGTALPFSIGRRIEDGAHRRHVIAKILRRGALLFALGLLYNGILRFDGWDHIRFFGVLQRLAVGYTVAALLMVFTTRKTQAAIFVGILVGYWALMVLSPVPGYARGDYSKQGNFANYVDRVILQPHQMFETYGDPEGPVSDLPAVATALLGVFAGYWLKSARPGEKKAAGLALAGLVCIAIGLVWAPLFPVIKRIWTSTYVLVAGGLSLELLALFYWTIDVKGWTKWTFPFVVIGMNPLTIYMLSAIVPFRDIAGFFLNGAASHAAGYKELVLACGDLLVKWLLLYFLYRQKIFLRL